jgi:hypothetical protein
MKDTTKLSKAQKVSYFSCLRPGCNTAYLLSDKKVIAKTVFFTETDGWCVDGTMDPYREAHRWALPKTSLASGGRLYTPSTIMQESIRKKYGYYFLSYYNIRNFHVSGDNLAFEARFRNNSNEQNSSCYDMIFNLIGTSGIQRMHFLSTGCTSYIRMNFGDLNLSGDQQDLSQFGINIQSWNKVRLEVSNKTVHIYLNGVHIYENKYHKSVGPILGIDIWSKTNGETDYVKLYNEKKALVYEEDFGGEVLK